MHVFLKTRYFPVPCFRSFFQVARTLRNLGFLPRRLKLTTLRFDKSQRFTLALPAYLKRVQLFAHVGQFLLSLTRMGTGIFVFFLALKCRKLHFKPHCVPA